MTSATSTAFNITPGAAAKLAFVVQPANSVAGATISPAVQVSVQDANINTVTSANNNISLTFATNPGAGTLSGTATVAAVNGIATFNNLSINKSGNGYSFSATTAGLTSATSSTFNVTPGAPSKLVYSVQPSNTLAATAISPALQLLIQDVNSNTVTTASNSVTIGISSNPAGGSLSGTTTVSAISGVATFSNLSINNGGNGYTLAASSAGLTGATSSSFNIIGAPSKLVFSVQPSNAVAGSEIAPAIQIAVQDANNNTVPNATNSITISIGSNPGTGTLSGTQTLSATGGIASFSNLSINKTGTGYTLNVTSAGLTTATSAAFNITPGAPSKIIYSAQPSNAVAGVAIAPAIQATVQDANSNTVTTANNTVTLSIGTNPGGGTLSGTSSVAAVNGVATFSNISINKTGNGYTLNAASSGLTGATSSTFNISPAAAAKLAFTVQPANTVAATAITPAVNVTVQDAFSNNIPTATNSITIAIGSNPGGGTLSGTLNASAVNGTASFNTLSINKTGTGYTLTASSAGLTGATSTGFSITPGVATQLAFTIQPANAEAGGLINSGSSVRVAVQDANSNVVTTATNSITVAIANNPAGGTLSGTLTLSAVSGLANFNTLRINSSGSGYTLSVSSGVLTNATSNSFNILPIPAPGNLVATGVSGTQINLTWTDNSVSETGFLIERKLATEQNFTQVASVGAGVMNYSNGGLASATQYTFRVRATNTLAQSAYSAEATASTFSPPNPPSSLNGHGDFNQPDKLELDR